MNSATPGQRTIWIGCIWPELLHHSLTELCNDLTDLTKHPLNKCIFVYKPILTNVWFGLGRHLCMLQTLVWFHYEDDMANTDHICPLIEILVLLHHDEEFYCFKSRGPNTVVWIFLHQFSESRDQWLYLNQDNHATVALDDFDFTCFLENITFKPVQ